MKEPILITGVERSGSTIITKVIEVCGGFIGSCSKRMENLHINTLVNALYNLHGADYRGQYPLPASNIDFKSKGLKKEIETYVLPLLEKYDGKSPWMYKNNRICQTWQMWRNHFPDAKWVVVRRKPVDIINSCKHTGYMNAFQDPAVLEEISVGTEEEGWMWWIKQHQDRFIEMKDAGINFFEVWPERMAQGDFSQVHEMVKYIGLDWKDDVISMVKPLLWKSRYK